jgi:uncharacterized protein involved in type VI secretion and phage assembly
MAGDGGRGNGVLVGVVTNLDDPDSLGRVRVRLPNFDNQNSYWARIASPMAGRGRGVLFRPEVDDEVLVCFEHGDPRRPYVLGGLWSSADTPPSDGGSKTENNWRSITSRSGHVLLFNDSDGSETIEIIDKTGGNSIVIDSASNTITIKSSQTIKVEATSIELSGTTSVKVQAPSIDLKADGDMSVSAGGNLTVRGALVTIN